ncbi:class I SAM-dependent methyltransferase [Diaphorobacter sp. HDW4A]|uniref:class I SAM-dependent methyltransferase n=1 Tax=Diaphorobacter sp. HDW4A TaxID=2714924 RepID=UPI001407846E|nr:class I SAM-dependent methyltransferase [Diaphorobacter sp. HDW4A]QIL81645.1 class I SAM-dependent methyltransferase [Diaphorobacter sp. HDW4A]
MNDGAEIRKGLRHLLSFSMVYDSFQHVVGAYKWRERVVSNHIAPLCSDSTRILDIGCGTGEILEYIPQRASYVGFDRNDEYISTASKRFSNRNARFICEDVNKNTMSKHGCFDIVLAIGILHHLDDNVADELFETAHYALKNNGVFLALDPVYTKNQSSAAKFVVSKDRGQAVRTDEEYLRLAKKRFNSTSAVIDDKPLRIPYTGIVMTCRKADSPL